jgi:chromosome segregation ATPase
VVEQLSRADLPKVVLEQKERIESLANQLLLQDAHAQALKAQLEQLAASVGADSAAVLVQHVEEILSLRRQLHDVEAMHSEKASECSEQLDALHVAEAKCSALEAQMTRQADTLQTLLREKDREIAALNTQLSQLCSGGEPSKKEAAEFLVRSSASHGAGRRTPDRPSTVMRGGGCAAPAPARAARCTLCAVRHGHVRWEPRWRSGANARPQRSA